MSDAGLSCKGKRRLLTNLDWLGALGIRVSPSLCDSGQLPFLFNSGDVLLILNKTMDAGVFA